MDKVRHMTQATFQAIDPTTGAAFGAAINEMAKSEVETLIGRAASQSENLAESSPKARAALLRAIALEVEGKRDQLIEITMKETALPNARLTGELSRTVFQLEQFAKMVANGAHLQPVIDLPDANWVPAARPDIRKANQSLGLAAIFAASNFPFAFSVIGGDSASAIAAGCPIVVKAHPSHPNTCRIIHEAVVAGFKKSGFSEDCFVMAEGVNPEITHWIASHPAVTAIGFTGSGMVGKLLMDISHKRPTPIPVYAEMGSLNPVFFTPGALQGGAEALAKAALDSATLGSGQFCTKPGILVIPNGTEGDEFLKHVESYLATLKVAPLLNKAIADRYSTATAKLAIDSKLKVFKGSETTGGFGVEPTVFVVDWQSAKQNHELLEEHFGPTTVIIRADFKDFERVASEMSGQLCAALHTVAGEKVSALINILAGRAGRVIMNGFPTAVAVTAAMQHGGQWPASSTHTTSVGLDAIYRFMRPVAHQNYLDELLPPALQNSNPWQISRMVNGELTNKVIG
jgi:2,5-dioxopentanoate dehydrogenase